ncbi:hypothetical protein Nepgr_008302 [Nepenthes gracilis]|uniref:Uncharacterized protein n=1 Tax=Nepenthes gracilis TaxID=150966 RepID=A0AAD3XJ36_NEPGR|nr:hypothetical protein Nepgr_008302 [Nepenthes gracilis]
MLRLLLLLCEVGSVKPVWESEDGCAVMVIAFGDKNWELLELNGKVGPPLGGGDFSLGWTCPFSKGGKLASAIPGIGNWGTLTGSYDGNELCRTDKEASGIKVGNSGARVPTWADDFNGDLLTPDEIGGPSWADDRQWRTGRRPPMIRGFGV